MLTGIIFFIGAFLFVGFILFFTGSKMQDERENHNQMYRILNNMRKNTNLLYELDREVLKEYEQRFLL